MIVSVFIWSCEDPTTLAISKIFSSNKLQTVYVDTFSVVTSVVQLDSVLTNGSGTILLGKYKDEQLGTIASRSYFQVGYNAQFVMDKRFIFDSVVLVLPYSHVSVGDTSKAMTVNLYELTENMKLREMPDANPSDVKLSAYVGTGFYNTSTIARASTPIVSKRAKFYPHKDTFCIRLPYAFGYRWFKFAQRPPQSGNTAADSSKYLFDVTKFIDDYFRGFSIDVDPNTDACIVGFKTNKLKLRFYYKKYVGDLLKETHFDFPIYSVDEKGNIWRGANSVYDKLQFNHIDFDRSATPYLSSLQVMKPVSTLNTKNLGFVQCGTGLVTRLDFPTVKSFFSINNGVILNAAFLEIYPTRGSYTKDLLPPSSLELFRTDMSNLPLTPVSGGVAPILYDFEFGANTVYRYQMFPYLFGEIKSTANYITPLILGPVVGAGANQGSSLQRVYLGDRFYPETKIKLKLYYSYAIN